MKFRCLLKSTLNELDSCVADRGYLDDKALTFCDFQSNKVMHERHSARYETFDGQMKILKILCMHFRHSLRKHRCVFQYACITSFLRLNRTVFLLNREVIFYYGINDSTIKKDFGSTNFMSSSCNH